MKQKQLLKCSKKMKVMCLSLTAVLFGVGLYGNAFAANTAKSEYYYKTSRYGFATPTRDKTDASAARIYHTGTESGYVQVKHRGVNYSVNNGSYYVAPKATKSLPNSVYQNGKRDCYLYITPANGQSCLMYGYWQPDS